MDILCRDTEAIDPAMRCSVLYFDQDTGCLHHAAAPNLPDYYNNTIDGLQARVGAGSCGTAAYTGERVIVEDVFSHPYWKSFRDVAKKVGFHACWSQPIYSKSKQVLGTFAMYYDEVRRPTEEELQLIDAQANLASLVIERRQYEEALHASEERFRDFAESSSDWFWEMDADLKFTYESELFFELSGMNSENYYGHRREYQVNPALEDIDSEKWREHFSILEKRMPFRNLEYQIMKLDGDTMSISVNGNPVFSPEGIFTGYRGTGTDITERKQVEEELKKLSRAVESSSAMVIITDIKGIIEYVNPKFTEITGYSSDEAIGQTPSLLYSGKQSQAIYDDIWNTVRSGHEWKGDIRNSKKDGTLYWDRLSISGVRDDDGNITHFVSIQDDVTQEYELSEKLSYQASHDALTGLINRHEFEHRANRLLSTILHDKTEHAMCFLDLDQFKVINDTCGHAAGDELLRQLGKLLQDTVRKHDTLARLGGDEFGVLMEHCSLEQGHRVANAILQAIRNYQIFWKGELYRIGASIGLVAITESTGNFTELFKQADAACYLAKDQGRNRIHTYHPEDSELAIRHGEMQWVGRITQALDDDRFCLYAQPIVSLNDDSGRHYELLLRMLDEQENIIPPGAFLPAAERYNLIERLDVWVLDHACAFLAEHPAFVEQIDFVSINLAGPSLTNKDFLASILQNFREYGVSPEKICFEITETVAISNLESAASFISELKQVGCRFALDDFGSGLSSFGYLKNLPVDYLKIDGMFVKDIVDDPIDYAIVKSINEIGHVMGMQTIAEFVENDEIKGMLKAIGVNYAQGYSLGKPQPLKALLDQLNIESTTPDYPAKPCTLPFPQS